MRRKTTIFFEEGYQVEEGDLVVFVSKIFTDANPGAEWHCACTEHLELGEQPDGP